jgi:hypothetical protein
MAQSNMVHSRYFWLLPVLDQYDPVGGQTQCVGWPIKHMGPVGARQLAFSGYAEIYISLTTPKPPKIRASEGQI